MNTGYEGGVVRRLEEKLERPLQWSICLLHFNELPFKRLFQKIDGRPIGPEIYTGPIGRKFNDCQSKKIVSFARIAVNFSLPITDSGDLS